MVAEALVVAALASLNSNSNNKDLGNSLNNKDLALQHLAQRPPMQRLPLVLVPHSGIQALAQTPHPRLQLLALLQV